MYLGCGLPLYEGILLNQCVFSFLSLIILRSRGTAVRRIRGISTANQNLIRIFIRFHIERITQNTLRQEGSY